MTNDRLCNICGDVALGFNYRGRQSCASCRIFFVRNAARREQLICLRANNCPIGTVNSRKRCTKCRLERCFQIGMKAPIGRTVEPFRRMTPATSSRPLGRFEVHCIRHIRKSLSCFPNEASLPISHERPTVGYLIDRPPVYMHHLIRYFARVPVFQNLEYAIKRKILKEVYASFAALRFAFQYDEVMDAYVILKDETGRETICLKHSYFCELIDDKEGLELNHQIIIHFSRIIEKNETVRDLLLSTLISEKLWKYTRLDYLRYFYAINCYLLQRYLESLYEVEVGGQKYRTLLYGTFNRLKMYTENFYCWIEQLRLHQGDEAFAELAAVEVEED